MGRDRFLNQKLGKKTSRKLSLLKARLSSKAVGSYSSQRVLEPAGKAASRKPTPRG